MLWGVSLPRMLLSTTGAALCPLNWAFASGSCCDKGAAPSRTECATGSAACAVDDSHHPDARKLRLSGLLPCRQIVAACPAGAVPYALHSGGLCCSGSLQTENGVPVGCDGEVTAMRGNTQSGFPQAQPGV